MRLRKWLFGLAVAGLCQLPSSAADNISPVGWIVRSPQNCCPCPPTGSSYIPGTMPSPSASSDPAQAGTQPPSTDLNTPERLGTGSTAQFTPTMMGDLLASEIIGPLTVTIGGTTTTLMRGLPIPANVFIPGARFNFDVVLDNGTVIPAGTPLPDAPLTPPTAPLPDEPRPKPPVTPQARASAGIFAIVARGAFKIAENESPRPMDRAYVTYNYFYDVDQSNRFGSRTDVHRQTLGLEKTFLDGNASLGARLPFIQSVGNSATDQAGVGDLTLISKYAFINDLDTGNVLSGGLAITIPTGLGFLPEFFNFDVHSFLFQPWVGGIWQSGNFFVQGFSSIVIPTDSEDFTLWLNDIGIGYMIYQSADPSRWIRYVCPMFETHVLTPLNQRGSLSTPYGAPDIVNLTGGVSVGVGQRSFLNIGGVVPVTGPRPFGFESVIQFNWRF